MRAVLVTAAIAALACAKPDTTPVAEAPVPNVVSIMASDFSFAAPDTIPAGMTEFHLMATAGLHHATIVRLEEGKTFADFTAAMQAMKPSDPPPAWVTWVGGPNPPAPGDTTIVTHDLTPGLYALICVVDVPDRIPHVAKGMMKPLVVAPATSPTMAPAPASDVNLTLVDYGFEVSPALTAGQHTLKVTNTAQQPHEFFLAKLDSGKTMADLGAWAMTFAGPMPARALGGLATMAPGATAYVRVQLTPGTYALLCFVPDAKDGKPHLEHGMVREFTIQ